MELRDIEYFAVVAKHRHLGRAAEALDLSQSALSKSLRRLEQEMRAKLVKRTPKGVELTAEGSTLLLRVHKVRMSLDDIKREVADVNRGVAGELRVGVGAGYYVHLLPLACSELIKAAPDVAVKIRDMDYGSSISALRNGELDIAIQAIQAMPEHELLQHALYDDRYVVIAAVSHRLAGRNRVTLGDLANERWILHEPTYAMSRSLHEVFAAHGLPPPRVTIETASPTLRLPVVASSDLLGYTWRSIVRKAASQIGLVELDVKELASTFHVGVIYRKEGYLSPVATRFIDALKSAAGQMVAR